MLDGEYNTCRTQCMVYRTQCMVYRTQCMVYRTQCMVYRTQCMVYRTQVHGIQNTVHGIQNTVHGIQLICYKVHSSTTIGTFTLDLLKVEALPNRCKVNRFNVFTLVYLKHVRLS